MCSVFEYLIFRLVTYNGQVTKLTRPEVNDMKIRNIRFVESYASIAH